MIERLEPSLEILTKEMPKSMSPEDVVAMKLQMQPYLDGGFPRVLAKRAALLGYLFPALDVVETAARWKIDVRQVADVFFRLGELLEMRWLRGQVESLEVAGQWHARARANLRDELFTQHNFLVERILQAAQKGSDPVESWIHSHQSKVRLVTDMMADMRSNAAMDYATVSVAVRSLARLVNETT